MEHFTTNQVNFVKHLNEMDGQLQSLNSTEFPTISDWLEQFLSTLYKAITLSPEYPWPEGLH